MNLFKRKNDNELLKYLDEDELELVDQISIKETFQTGSFILEERHKNRDIFVIIKGEVSICILDKEKNEQEITRLYAGGTFGEINFIIPVQRTAYVKALNDVTIKRYPYDKLLEIMKDNYEISAKIFAALNDSLAKRVVRTTQDLARAINKS
ncbi:MAG TPA: cyclic nucleotide-binding domain-containing protein [Candidatus Cloacimonetes bacterium]|nr:cyclic nucleotide-binding domain-containing protein [Candidatus Cloacimonadota bacterium]HEX37523.1 cyclic nucleotide-binding domain-containing protein [Candidatus Cloacimonadota bacterium]